MTLSLRQWGVCLLTVFLVACANGPSNLPGDSIIIDHVTLLDGRGSHAALDARIVVSDGRIASVSRSSTTAPPVGPVIDGSGKFLLPGYIDMHAHLLFPRCAVGDEPPSFDRAVSERALSQQLDFGITTVRSPATPTIEGLRLTIGAGRQHGRNCSIGSKR